MPELLFKTLVIVMGLMTALWVVSLVRRNAAIVDSFWGGGFVVISWFAWYWNSAATIRPFMLALLTTIWGLRLSGYLWWRNRGHAEDRRYAAMRRRHGRQFWWVSLFTVFWLQALILWFVSMPLQVVIAHDRDVPLWSLDALGVVIWSLGFLFESLGDWELAQFKAIPANAGRVMDRGLWRYTRHPNYFGDFCVWWGLYLIAAAGGAWWTILSPILMTVLLLKVSGVTLLESTIAERRPEYSDYKARTSAFFPLPPRTRG